MRLFKNDNRSYEEVHSAFRWDIPDYFTIGIAD